MRSDSGRTQSAWMDTADVPQFPALTEDATADVCVIGAGIAGMMTAYHLAREGRRVIVIDDGPIAGGETGRTTAHLTNAFDDRYLEIEKMHGSWAARLTAESHTAAIDDLEEVVRTEGIDCDFRRVDGWLFLGDDDRRHRPTLLDEEYEAAKRAGIPVTLEKSTPIPGKDVGWSLRFPRQAQFHPVRFLAGVANAIVARGGRIHTGTHADSVEGGDKPCVKTADGRTIHCKAICVCTNSPISDYVVTHLKQAPYRTYVIGATVAAGAVEPGLYWDTPSPYHYVRLMTGTAAPGEDVLIVGGEDHKTGQDDDAEARFRCLEEWLRERFPAAGAIVYRWSGQVMEPADYLAFIGRNPDDTPNVYIATGDSGNGMTHGAIAGMLLTDLVLGRPNSWAGLYDPKRVSMRSAGELLKENLNVAAQYTDWVKPGRTDAADIPRGEGVVLRRGVHRIAAYRDDDGTLHERSAVCTHLACIVRWNSGEKTWDCPCHGSRFDGFGNVVNGPAIKPLGPAPESDNH